MFSLQWFRDVNICISQSSKCTFIPSLNGICIYLSNFNALQFRGKKRNSSLCMIFSSGRLIEPDWQLCLFWYSKSLCNGYIFSMSYNDQLCAYCGPLFNLMIPYLSFEMHKFYVFKLIYWKLAIWLTKIDHVCRGTHVKKFLTFFNFF